MCYTLLQEREIESCSATEVYDHIAVLESQRLDCPFAIRPMPESGKVQEQGVPVVPFSPLAIERD